MCPAQSAANSLGNKPPTLAFDVRVKPGRRMGAARQGTRRLAQSAALARGIEGIVAPKIGDARYWQDRAEKARLAAEEITHPPSKREMQQIASAYDRLAKHAEARAAAKKGRQS
jgi:hypothetical protein